MRLSTTARAGRGRWRANRSRRTVDASGEAATVAAVAATIGATAPRRSTLRSERPQACGSPQRVQRSRLRRPALWRSDLGYAGRRARFAPYQGLDGGATSPTRSHSTIASAPRYRAAASRSRVAASRSRAAAFSSAAAAFRSKAAALRSRVAALRSRAAAFSSRAAACARVRSLRHRPIGYWLRVQVKPCVACSP